MDQTEPENSSLCRQQQECHSHSNMDSTLYLFDTGLFEIQRQAWVVTPKHVAIIATEFIYTKRAYGVTAR